MIVTFKRTLVRNFWMRDQGPKKWVESSVLVCKFWSKVNLNFTVIFNGSTHALSTCTQTQTTMACIPVSSSAVFLFGVATSSFHSQNPRVFCFFSLKFWFLKNNTSPHDFWSSYLSVSSHFHVLITTDLHYYICLSFSLHSSPSQSLLSNCITYVCHICSCSFFFCCVFLTLCLLLCITLLIFSLHLCISVSRDASRHS